MKYYMKKDQSSNEGILSFFGCLEKKKQIKLPSRRHYNHTSTTLLRKIK